MEVFVKISMIIAAGYLLGVFVSSIRNRRKPVKWYTLVSSDGRVYMDYSNLKDAMSDRRLFANSGVCYQYTVGKKTGRIVFVW